MFILFSYQCSLLLLLINLLHQQLVYTITSFSVCQALFSKFFDFFLKLISFAAPLAEVLAYNSRHIPICQALFSLFSRFFPQVPGEGFAGEGRCGHRPLHYRTFAKEKAPFWGAFWCYSELFGIVDEAVAAVVSAVDHGEASAVVLIPEGEEVMLQ